MMINQEAALNSPQWFNTGIHWAYGIDSNPKGQYYYDFKLNRAVESVNGFEHPQAHACLPYRALISTPTGPMTIGDIVKNNCVGLDVFDRTGITKIVATKEVGVKPVYRVVLRNGNFIEATADHLVWASTDRRNKFAWTQISDLKPSMYLQQRTDTYMNDLPSEEILHHEAILAGWLQSDGFVGQYSGTNSSLTIEFMTVNDEEESFLKNSIQHVFPDAHFHVTNVKSQNEKLDINRMRFYGENLRSFVDRYDLLVRGSMMRVPSIIMNGTRQQICSYLKSIFQAEGHVDKVVDQESLSCSIRMGMVSVDLLRDIQKLLFSLGIYARLRNCNETRTNRQEFWTIDIGNKESRRKFHELIGFVSLKKSNRLEKSLVNGNDRFLSHSRGEIISHVEMIGSEMVYDIQTESESFLHNNVVVHNCFILGVKDDLFGPNGIFDTARREAQIFYFGSGAGSNYATLRGKGEPVSGGGVSSGMMSFLDIYDAGGGAIKSGGKTRRAAKMDICSDSHPEIREFIEWKMRQEKMVRLLIESGMSGGFEDEAYRTVRGMNSNNTVAFTHKFFDALKNDKDWELRWVTDPSHVSDRFPARELWEKVVYCTWFSADPGIHATDTINEWNTCIGDERIVSSNPCSEYLWFNETACNLASINLVKFYDSNTNVFDVESFCKAVDVWQTALDITVSMAQYPASDICEKSMQYRTTGLGYTNLGGLLMLMGYGYASAEGQQVAGAITAILGGRSYVQSSILASNLSAYPAYERNVEHHLRVIRNHRRAAYGLNTEYEGVTKAPRGIDSETFPAVHSYLLESARKQWDNALTLGKMHGFRNAQTTVLAPTGTISFAMDADTFGIEPDYALIKYKALAGGGYAVITNRLVDPALKNIGYADREREAILKHIEKTGSVEGAPYLRMDHYNVFDTAVAAAGSTRSLSASSHIEMMAACQPFLSGAISKTVNLPESATEKDISDAYLYGYELGLKAIAVFRANSKAASVMFTRAEDMAKRETIDLGSKHFDVEKIFHRQFVYEMPQEIEMHVATSYDEEINTELAVEMPAYGCKDGVCSI
jgi:adenosylcobalamin-dependent ribonucleoside-diphosphate reductase